MRLYRSILVWLLRFGGAAAIALGIMIFNFWMHPEDGPDEASRGPLEMALVFAAIIGVGAIQLAVAELLALAGKHQVTDGSTK